MIVSLKTVVPDGLLCPAGKRHVKHCNNNLPGPYLDASTTPVPLLVRSCRPVRRGVTCRCDDRSTKIILDFTSPQIALMSPDEECEASDLFERECWDSLSHAQQIELGKCIACLVRQGMLPLENLGASPKSANHVIYRKLPS